MGAREDAHKLLDDAVATIKAGAANGDRFDRVDSFAATLGMVFDEIDMTPEQVSPVASL